MTPAARRAVAKVTGAEVVQAAALSGGCIGDVWRVALAGGRQLVVKTAGPDGTLDIEGYMLDYLARTNTVPVPDVIHAAPDLLVIAWVETAGQLTGGAQEHAAGLLAALDAVGVAWEEVDDLVHGTTMITNAIVEDRLADTALVATEGFADTLVIGRQNRRHLYRLDLPPKLPTIQAVWVPGAEARSHNPGRQITGFCPLPVMTSAAMVPPAVCPTSAATPAIAPANAPRIPDRSTSEGFSTMVHNTPAASPNAAAIIGRNASGPDAEYS